MKHIRKIIACMLILAMAVTMSVFAFADDDVQKPVMRLGDVTVYSASKGSVAVIPIIVDGTIDMQCYDFTVTFDRKVVNALETEEGAEQVVTGITAFGGYQEVKVDNNNGTIRIAGVTTEETAKTATGQVGQIQVQLLNRFVGNSVATDASIEVTEFGFDTEAADVQTDGATVTFMKEDAPDPTEPAPTEPTPTEAAYTLGDVNNDEKINADDALAVLKHAASIEMLDETMQKAADVNGDEKINADDALMILKYAASIIDSFE